MFGEKMVPQGFSKRIFCGSFLEIKIWQSVQMLNRNLDENELIVMFWIKLEVTDLWTSISARKALHRPLVH